ncbi:MAG: hypothetical protein EHM87_13780 [Burkholderiales bacterium]|nr:MAG: hypothetical protein EHM87_13780 [Burkholderiales bacterium]
MTTRLLLLLAALLWGALAAAQPRTSTYEGTERGVTTRIVLRVDGPRVEGAMQEGTLALGLRGTLAGQRLSGTIVDPASGRDLLPITGELRADTLVISVQPDAASPPRMLSLRRVDAVPGGAPAPSGAGAGTGAAAGSLDAAIVGRWRNESQINSPGGAGGFASFSTVRTLELGGDGRARQSVRSAGGGGNWSSQGGETVEFVGRWQVRGAELWVQAEGTTGFVRAGTYRRVGERLVTENAQGRRIWER